MTKTDKTKEFLEKVRKLLQKIEKMKQLRDEKIEEMIKLNRELETIFDDVGSLAKELIKLRAEKELGVSRG